MLLMKNPRFYRGLIGIVLKNVPPTENEVVRVGQRNEFSDQERTPIGALPRRMVPICVSDPTGHALPVRVSSTPAMNVVLTAPIPGSKIPSFPFGGTILSGFSMSLLACAVTTCEPQPHNRN